MSLLMIHKAYMPVYSDPDFSCGTDGTGRTDQPKVVQEVLADLKSITCLVGIQWVVFTKFVQSLADARLTATQPR